MGFISETRNLAVHAIKVEASQESALIVFKKNKTNTHDSRLTACPGSADRVLLRFASPTVCTITQHCPKKKKTLRARILVIIDPRTPPRSTNSGVIASRRTRRQPSPVSFISSLMKPCRHLRVGRVSRYSSSHPHDILGKLVRSSCARVCFM